MRRADRRGGARPRRRQLHPRAGRDPGHRRRIRLGQVDAGADAAPARDADQRHRPLRRPGRLRAGGRRAASLPPRAAGGLPGPLCVLEPAHVGLPAHRRALDDPQRCPAAFRLARPGGPAARAGRHGGRPHEALPAPVLRRPAPAHRHRPGAGAGARGDHLRRGRLRARRLDPGAGDRTPEGAARPARPRLPLHRPRPAGGARHRRSGHRHAPGQDRRGGARPRDIFEHPRHAYTQALLAASPVADPDLQAERRGARERAAIASTGS